MLSKTLNAGKTIAFLEIELRNKTTDSLIATGNHDMFILQPRTTAAARVPELVEEPATEAKVAAKA